MKLAVHVVLHRILACVRVDDFFGWRLWYAGGERCFDLKWFGALIALMVLILSPLIPFLRLKRMDPLSRSEAAFEVRSSTKRKRWIVVLFVAVDKSV